MKLFLSTAPIAFAVGIVSQAAFAQDARDTHFDGPYVSGAIGLASQGNDRGDTIVFDTDRDGSFDNRVDTADGANAFSPGFCSGSAGGAVPDAGCGPDNNRPEYALRAGYDKRMGENFVVGGLVEVSKTNARDFTTAYSTTPASYTTSRELDHAISLRARAGYTPGGGALFYATGGVSNAKIDHSFRTTNTANSFTEQNDGDRVWGWQAGGGAEVMVTDRVSLGLEYLYNRFRDSKYSVAVGPGSAAANNPFLLASGGTNLRPSDRNFDYHSLRATLSFQL